MSTRILFVHAHPDDETLSTGATIAACVRKGVDVTVITCTSGEEGEVVDPDLQHLLADRDLLGAYRREELGCAMSKLEVTSHHFLGGAGRYRDSGMFGEDSNSHPQSFWLADLEEAAVDLVRHIRHMRPDILITYDPFGGYGHPDHIQAHRVAMYATTLAATPSYRQDLGAAWDVPRGYWTALSRSLVAEAIQRTPPAERGPIFSEIDVDSSPFFVDDRLIDVTVQAPEVVDQKKAALHCYRSQLDMQQTFLAHVAVNDDVVLGVESFRTAWVRQQDAVSLSDAVR